MNTHSLQQSFHEDIEHAERLLALIDAEYQALQARDLATLEKLLADKLPLLSLLDQHGQQRSQALLARQLTADAEGLRQLAATQADGEELLKASERLAELIGQCQQANIRNGRLIKANQSSTTSLLNILRGTHGQSLYDRYGSAARIGTQRPISRA